MAHSCKVSKGIRAFSLRQHHLHTNQDAANGNLISLVCENKNFFVLGDGAAKLSVMAWKQIALQLMVG